MSQSKSETKEPTRKPRFSLKWKWALSTTVGVLIIFLAIIVILFNSFTSIMIKQEQSHVSDSMVVLTDKLSGTQGPLTTDDITQRLQGQLAPMQTNGKAARQFVFWNNVNVTIFGPSGERLFASQNNRARFKRIRTDTVARSQVAGESGLIGRAPIISRSTHQVIGYAQIDDQMTDLHRTSRQLGAILGVLALLAVFCAAVYCYIMASFLLRPMEEISDTMNIVRADPQAEVRVPDLNRNDELSDLAQLFNGMLDQMQRYIDQQTEFVEDVSHELRTPVAILQGHMEMLKRWGKDDPEVLNESIDASLQETKRMESLVQEMLDLSRAEQIELNFGNEITNVTKVVHQVYNDFEMIHPDFTFVLDDDVEKEVDVQIYRNHLEQVLIILLDNAVKYSTKRKEIHVTYERSERNVDIAVQDFGEGIAPDNIDKVFNRFYRVDKARSRNKGGNGLGLSIARRLIEAYHGTISIESSLGYGSIFQISLPILTGQEVEILEEKRDMAETQRDQKPLASNLLEDPKAEDQASKQD